MDLTACGGGSTGCYSLSLVNDGDNVTNIVPPCLKLPIKCSSSESFSTLDTLIPFEAGDFMGGACLCLCFDGECFLQGVT